jgi:hypothetical protein
VSLYWQLVKSEGERKIENKRTRTKNRRTKNEEREEREERGNEERRKKERRRQSGFQCFENGHARSVDSTQTRRPAHALHHSQLALSPTKGHNSSPTRSRGKVRLGCATHEQCLPHAAHATDRNPRAFLRAHRGTFHSRMEGNAESGWGEQAGCGRARRATPLDATAGSLPCRCGAVEWPMLAFGLSSRCVASARVQESVTRDPVGISPPARLMCRRRSPRPLAPRSTQRSPRHARPP